MKAISTFLSGFRQLIDSHVVNFFKDKLWGTVDREWMECLRKEPVEDLLGIPSGLVREHWPPSLQEFVLTLRSLVLSKEQNLSHTVLNNFHVSSLGSVISQGMNTKKKHEVEVLAAAVSTIAHGVNAQKIVDVGSGQGYLAQVLSFEYQLSVIAVDASGHHSAVTNARAKRIKKHYAAKLQKYRNEQMKIPQTITCEILSSDFLAALSITAQDVKNEKPSDMVGSILGTKSLRDSEAYLCQAACPRDNGNIKPFLVLAGLHACGDLSVNMLRTFVDCKEVKALISIGCCYNLLSEEHSQKTSVQCGFPMSNGAKISGVALGKSARDLACQSAERWQSLTKEAALQNFQLHAFRSAFQMVLDEYCPGILMSSPSIGRQGKALRRRQSRRQRESQFYKEASFPCSCKLKYKECACASSEVCLEKPCFTEEYRETQSTTCSRNHILFEEFSMSAFHHLGFDCSKDVNLCGMWDRCKPFFDFIGPYWSLRAALGPVIESYILLDRLLFLQEKAGVVEAHLVPLFDPKQSPRNVAIVARKSNANIHNA
ncbi:hypothetical protein AXF42_Ash010425 [Apostasia shenzhenica]|uniref:Methyltransferase domain-containing protein n=1 Tax=Apostasia shenzhenica TaxID=1088818 RepID=A0A2I0BE21_9ASPA|nr:hypothetical protein AXF42_Ash010425 [Apostasia shenzhenica]